MSDCDHCGNHTLECICGGDKHDNLPRLDIVCPKCDRICNLEKKIDILSHEIEKSKKSENIINDELDRLQEGLDQLTEVVKKMSDYIREKEK